MKNLNIYIGKNATDIEKNAAQDLAKDLTKATGFLATVLVEDDNLQNNSILVGSPETSKMVNQLYKLNQLGLNKIKGNSEGGSIDIISTEDDNKIIVLAGIDSMGTQYTVYDFCAVELKVDPGTFWTGIQNPIISDFNLSETKERILHCPLVPIRCYFDNDNDELANMTKPYLEIDISYWKEIINTLVRLKYNAIDLHDHLGRVEYTTRAPYLKLRPGYTVNVELLDQIIDYAKSKGMKIQVSFYLGWHFKTISDQAAHDWTGHKEEWLETWRYYLKETPIGRSDIFLNRPRDQKLDHPFRSDTGERPSDVFNEAFPLMKDLIKEHNENAIIIVDLYTEGLDVFRDGFRPKPVEDYILSWPDNGFGEFSRAPEDLSPYKSGIYMHAGFWYNHVVSDPYPSLLEKSMKEALLDKGMSNYCLVNGQTFRHFLLNLEITSLICWDPENFNSEDFLKSWLARYFPNNYIKNVEKILNLLHEGQKNGQGYVQILSYISEWQSIGTATRKCDGKWLQRLTDVTSRIEILEEALNEINIIRDKITDINHFFHDHIELPVKLLLEINQILQSLLMIPESENCKEASELTNNKVLAHTALRESGDRNTQWHGWYSPTKARPNGGYPQLENWEL